ncbi:MAG: response regulator [Planctomycetes bacterium]|nr:response regulator [Planctomycetota bacterium]
MTSPTTRVLVVDDDPLITDLLKSALEDRFLVDVARTCDEATAGLARSSYQVVVTDVLMEGKSGLDLLDDIRQRFQEVDVIVITAYATLKIAIEALNKGARRFLLKPLDVKELRRTVTSLVDERTRRHELSPYEFGKTLVLPNDLTLVSTVARDVAEIACRAGHSESFGFALRAILGEALPNSIIHGNLAVSRETEKLDTRAIENRMKDDRFGKRRLRVEYKIDSEGAWIRIEDEGPGFDYQSLPDPTDESKILELHGRGIYLMRQLADELKWEGRGNVVQIVKRAEKAPE